MVVFLKPKKDIKKWRAKAINVLKKLCKILIFFAFFMLECIFGALLGVALIEIIDVQVSDFVIIGVGFLATMISVLSIIITMENKAKEYAEKKLAEFSEKMWRLIVYYDEYFFWKNETIEGKKEYIRELSTLKEKIEVERMEYLTDIQRLRLRGESFLVGDKSYQYGEKKKDKEVRVNELISAQKKVIDESISRNSKSTSYCEELVDIMIYSRSLFASVGGVYEKAMLNVADLSEEADSLHSKIVMVKHEDLDFSSVKKINNAKKCLREFGKEVNKLFYENKVVYNHYSLAKWYVVSFLIFIPSVLLGYSIAGS